MKGNLEHERVIYDEQVNATIEEILRNYFGVETTSIASLFVGMLSTFPENVGGYVTDETLISTCSTLCFELKNHLEKSGTNAQVVTSTSNSRMHTYLIIGFESMNELIVDPSIGQFLKGHNHVFVGTRGKLRDIVVNHTGLGKKFEFVNVGKLDSPEQIFERIWGNLSCPFKVGGQKSRTC